MRKTSQLFQFRSLFTIDFYSIFKQRTKLEESGGLSYLVFILRNKDLQSLHYFCNISNTFLHFSFHFIINFLETENVSIKLGT